MTAWLLLPLSLLFLIVTGMRRHLYRLGALRTSKSAVPVIVIGNLIVGGAGKTPVTIAVASALRRAGWTPGLVSRGHGGSALKAREVCEVTPETPAFRCGDEPLLLRLRTGAPVVVGRDRPAAVQALLDAHPEVDIVVADDGLQHLALRRDVQVLVFDERGVGNGWLLPAGPLRETLPTRVPPASLVVYNAPAATTPLPGHLARRSFCGAVSLQDWWRGRPATLAVLDSLRTGPVIAAAGIARPDRFFDMLRTAGLQIEPLRLPDHHDYATSPWPAGARDVVVTEKDAVKLDPLGTGSTRVWVAPLDLDLDVGFDAALLALLPSLGHAAHGNPTA